MKILIVDDSTHVLNELQKAFKRSFPNAEITTAWSFPKAEELLQSETYEIIMLDGELSERITDPPEHAFGYWLIPLIRASLSQEAKIIMMSSSNDMNIDGMRMGADLTLSKNDFFEAGKVVNSLNLDLTISPGL